MSADVENEVALSSSAYPSSIQAGIPKLGEMPKGWSRQKLGDLVKRVERPAKLTDSRSYQLVTAKRNRGGIVAREVLRGDQIRTKTQFFVAAGDFLISNRQISHGACGIVPATLDGALVSNEYTAFHTTSLLDPAYLSALSHSVYFQQICFHSSIGVHVEKLVFRLEDWMRWEFNIPPLYQQRRIVAVLDTWDRAIDQTERVIAAKLQRLRALIAKYATEFHGERVEFGELADLISERIQPGTEGAPETSIELENIESMTGQVIGSEPVSKDSALRSKFKAGDTLFGKLRPYLAKFAAPQFDGICSTEIWVLRSKGTRLDPLLLPFIVQTQEFYAAATIQSGSKMPRADWDLVSAAPVPCPHDKNKQSQVASLLTVAFNAAQPEYRKLAALRVQKKDLLKRLTSGEWLLDGRFDATAPTPSVMAGAVA